MAHPEPEAVEPSAAPGNPLDDILRLAGEEPDEPAEPEADELPEDPEDEPEADAEEEPEDEDDEGNEPPEAIKPPVSLNKEQRAAFEQLPPELQKAWSESEAQRNEQVRAKTTEAAEATRNATSHAQAALAEIQQQYAAELAVYAQAFQPVEPDLSLLATNPAEYAQQAALYKQMSAQYQDLMQRAHAARGQADQTLDARKAEAIQSEQARLKAEWPDILDPAKQADLWNGIQETAQAIGFDPSILQNANATELLALKKIGDLRAKADKWDAFQASKMQKVRAAKDLPKVTRPGTPAAKPSTAQQADASWQRARQTRSGDDYAAALEAMGIKL